MADTVTSTKIVDGPKKVVYKFTNSSDGTGESAVLKVDVSALETGPGGKTCTGVSIDSIIFITTGMKVKLLWDATTDETILEVPEDVAGELIFDHIGGIPKTTATGVTGDILFTTTGHAAGDGYTIILEMTKTYG